MKKTIFSIIIIIIAAGAITGFTIWSKKHAPVVPNENPVTTSDESKYLVTKEPQMVSVAEDSYLLGINGSYPQFSQADASFNKKIADTITDGVKSFKDNASADYKARLEIGGDEFQKQFEQGGMYTYEVKTDLVQSNDNDISFVIHINGYSGGAHGFHGIITFNYDVKNKKELMITDFISIKDVAQKSYDELNQKLGDIFFKEGVNPKLVENFQNFTFTNDVITVYFPEYQVAPYVAGEQQVIISRK